MRFTTLFLLYETHTHTNAPQLRIPRFAANVSEVPTATYPQITLYIFSVFRDVQSHSRYLRYSQLCWKRCILSKVLHRVDLL